MAMASPLVNGAPALTGAAATTQAAVPSQSFSPKLRPLNAFCSMQSSRCKLSSSSSNSLCTSGFRVSSSTEMCKALLRVRRTGISRASAAIDEWTESVMDLEIEPKRPLRPVVERFNIHHEKNVTLERVKELGVERWSKWDCGPGVTTYWKWQVDELVYISKGSVEVVPNGCWDAAIFYAGDLVRFPKWFEASLTFEEDYEQHYKFCAYGD